MEKKDITISLEEARMLYKNNNTVAKQVALKAYSKEELINDLPTIESLKSLLDAEDLIRGYVNIPKEEGARIQVLAEFMILAKYFNGSWRKTRTNHGWCCFKSHNDFNGTDVKGIDNMYLTLHTNVIGPNVYFRNREDLITALQILGNDKVNMMFA